ncbi:hypothetical protein AB0L70_16940 [Kribbella sp. NPDC051952]|uniref:HAAS signaling domain-containing protein n=1 Tax=Kribbella sp. NPDC051952 TaxID=3154851 RepID=UPI003433C62A
MSVQHDPDQLVDAYLEYLTKAAEPLPADRRTELVAEVTSHIAEARAAGATSEDEVRQMLKRLGDPDDLVAASTDGLVLVDRYTPRYRGRDVAALLLLAFGAVFAILGWVVGAVLFWRSDRWTLREKLLGTLVWPGGFVFVYFIATLQTGFTLPIWLGIPIIVLVAAAEVLALGKLVRNARPGRSRLA